MTQSSTDKFYKVTPLFFFSLAITHLDVSEHVGQVVGLGAQVEVVEDVLLHVVQVRVFNILLLSERETAWR